MMGNVNFRKWIPACAALIYLTVCWWMLIPTSMATEPGKPTEAETVYVAVERAYLFAGPSKDYYPTSDTKRGTPLEVYHRTHDGWLGVRPPDSSFSWVPASQAYLLPGGRSIEITDTKAVSWIGTELGSAKQYRWQVQLNLGEQLKVLGESSVANGAEAREALWYKVAPPDGEFRWIEQSAVSKIPPDVSKVNSTDSPAQMRGDSSTVVTASARTTGENNVNHASYTQPIPTQYANDAVSPAQSAAQFPSSPKATIPGQKKSTANGNRKNTSNTSRKTNDFDGWYAFEMNDNGMRFPLLDKLSGRDRGNASGSQGPRLDPLAHDPFSLAMQGQPTTNHSPTSLPTKSARLTDSDREILAGSTPRSWRDPRTLKSRRGQAVPSAPENAPVQLATTNQQPLSAPADGVDQANFVSTTQTNSAQTPFAPGDANWLGNQPSNTAESANPSHPMTASAGAAELQLALNQTVSQPPAQWNLDPLAERARFLIEHGANAVERGQARLLMDRIDEFRSVVARSQGLPAGSLTFSSGTTNTPINSVAPTTALQQANPSFNPTAPDAAGMQQYDATGWLVPVHSTSPDQPTHAITNDSGDVIAYVSGMAGMNLEHYRNQPVGIVGLRGYLPHLKAPHIQAQRVTRLRP
jgi:hypothetical protein